MSGGDGCRGSPLNVAGKGGLSSLGAGIAGCWHCVFTLVLCSPDWFVLLCCKLGDCCQFGVPCPSCAVVLTPSMASVSLSPP